jgi:hypothetical protein
MKFPFTKKSKQAAPAADVAVATPPPAAPPPEAAKEEILPPGRVIADLLATISQVPLEAGQDIKPLRAAFSKAARAMLGDASLATEETIGAVATYSRAVQNPELRGDTVTNLGALAVKYPAFADRALAALAPALDDGNLDVRTAAVAALRDIARTNKDKEGAVADLFVSGSAGTRIDLREGSVTGLVAIAVVSEEQAGKAVAALGAVLARDPAGDTALQPYRARNLAAKGLAEIAVARPVQVDAALKGLLPGLNDKDLFVRYSAVDGLRSIGATYEPKQAEIVDALQKAQKDAILVLQNKIDGAIRALRPPAPKQQTPEEAAAEVQRQEASRKAAEAAAAQHTETLRVKQQAEAEKKNRLATIKQLANKLPGAAI